MYIDELREESVSIDNLYLDPNNPRFWTTDRSRSVSDHRTPDDRVQSKAEERLENHKIRELRNSILRNGFLPLDRIVVRPLEGHDGKYVVVEGNRRLAALRKLRNQILDHTVVEENITDEYLDRLIEETKTIPVLVYEGSQKVADISWLLQGIRHIGGIKDWDTAQRAKLVVDQVDDPHQPRSFSEAGETFGLSAQAVGRLYRGYKALKQMQDDDEYGEHAKNEYFTLFEEAYRNRPVREWLNWSNDGPNSGFRNTENCKTFYAWISPDQDAPTRPGVPNRRIHNPRHVKLLGNLVADRDTTLFNQVDNYDLSIEDAYRESTVTEPTENWVKKLRRAQNLVKAVPISALEEDPEEYASILDEMIDQLTTFRALVPTPSPSDDESS